MTGRQQAPSEGQPYVESVAPVMSLVVPANRAAMHE